PMVNSSYCETFGWVSQENLARMKELTYKANDVLKKLFDDAGLTNIKYLYYNPGVAKTHASSPTPTSPLASANTISFRGWPDLQLR
ncbi:hypothetical protein ONR49_25430, partial [Salmonella enterica subsp. enterica serovar Virginia]|nr:hypothetical protein [Salmonella enterica subsp. enterica serovar Virginia]